MLLLLLYIDIKIVNTQTVINNFQNVFNTWYMDVYIYFEYISNCDNR